MPRRRPFLMLVAAWAVQSACDGGTGTGPTEGLEYRIENLSLVEKVIEGVAFPVTELRVEIAAVNVGRSPVELRYGGCPFELEAFQVGASSTGGAWRSVQSQSWPSSLPFACNSFATTYVVEPGDTLRPRELQRSFPLARILADSLPVGPYDLEATVLAEGSGEAVVPLGRVDLPATRHPVPELTTSRDGFRYHVAVAQDVQTVKLSIELRSATRDQPLERDLSAACPIRILAFRDSIELTTVPLPEPAWEWPPSCPAGEQAVRPGPGETRVFDVQIGGAGASAGTYTLLAVVVVDGRPIRIAAGEYEVA